MSSSNTNILDVMKGSMQLNDLASHEIQSMPPKVFQGLKSSQIQGMSANSIESLLDSDRAAHDPLSMFSVIRKMNEDSLDSAIALMNEKMQNAVGSFTPWRPPLSTQEIVIKDFMRKWKSNKLSDTDVLNKFVESMCPFVAGMPPGAIKQLPKNEVKTKEVLNCISQSYEDLSKSQKKQVISWATKGKKTIDFDELGQFMLDLPLRHTRKSMTSKVALDIVSSGKFLKLSSIHPRYFNFAKQVIRKLVNDYKDKFDDISFLNKMGKAQCEIPLRKLKKIMGQESISHLASYTMIYCKSKEELLEENLEQCNDEVSLRLKRCQLMKQEIGEMSGFGFSSSFSFGFQTVKPQRLALDTFKMMTELADSLLGGIELSQIGPSQIKNAAGALGGLDPFSLEKIPQDSVLNALDSIKNNTNLTPKQKSIMFKKAKTAGFSLNEPSSLINLGELITEISAEDFMHIAPQNLRSSLKMLTRKIDSFSSSQRKAIVSQLQDSAITEMLSDDLGSLASEIPLSKLETMDDVNLSLINAQKWDKPQAVKLVDLYRNTTEESDVTATLVGDLGSTANGLKCQDIMNLQYYDVAEAVTSIDLYADMPPDMDECIQAKLHYTNQIEFGTDYMNGTNITEMELEEVLEAIPDDVAMFYSPKTLNETPDALCSIIYEKIGQAKLNTLPIGSGDYKRKQLAAGAIHCIKRTPDREFTVLEEADVLFLGNMICDVTSETYKGMTEDGFLLALEFMRNCIHRFTREHVAEIQTLAKTHLGPSSAWDDSDLSILGSVFALMSPEDISEVNNEYFAEAYDDIIPPKISEELDSRMLLNNDAFKNKAVEALVESNEPSTRRKRQEKTPTYEDIASLGQSNSNWTVDELKRISTDDLKASLNILGTVEKWSAEQRKTLIEQYEKALTRTTDKWTPIELKDAKYILTDLTDSQIQQLDISALDVTTSLSDIPWSKTQRTQAVDRYMSKTSKTIADLSAEDVAGLGNLFCGLVASKLNTLSDNVLSNAMKDMGNLACYDQEQLDELFAKVKKSNGDSSPDDALIGQMGSIAAGMEVDDLKQVTEAQMPSFTETAIILMNGERFRSGMTTSKLQAAGATNVAAIIRTKSLFDALSSEQRNALRTTAYGDDAELEEDNSDSTVQPNEAGGGDDGAGNTKGDSSSAIRVKSCSFGFILSFVVLFFMLMQIN